MKFKRERLAIMQYIRMLQKIYRRQSGKSLTEARAQRIQWEIKVANH